jgi:hypothetical protein
MQVLCVSWIWFVKRRETRGVHSFRLAFIGQNLRREDGERSHLVLCYCAAAQRQSLEAEDEIRTGQLPAATASLAHLQALIVALRENAARRDSPAAVQCS